MFTLEKNLLFLNDSFFGEILWGSKSASFIKHNHIHTACADYIV